VCLVSVPILIPVPVFIPMSVPVPVPTWRLFHSCVCACVCLCAAPLFDKEMLHISAAPYEVFNFALLCGGYNEIIVRPLPEKSPNFAGLFAQSEVTIFYNVGSTSQVVPSLYVAVSACEHAWVYVRVHARGRICGSVPPSPSSPRTPPLHTYSHVHTVQCK